MYHLFNVNDLEIKYECGSPRDDPVTGSLVPVCHVSWEGERHSLAQGHLSHSCANKGLACNQEFKNKTFFESCDDLSSTNREGERYSNNSGGLNELTSVLDMSILKRRSIKHSLSYKEKSVVDCHFLAILWKCFHVAFN